MAESNFSHIFASKKLKTNIMIEMLEKNDWDHFHDVILGVTYETSKVNLNQQEMEKLFLELPEDMQNEAYEYGMNDTCWRDSLWEWYETNKMNV